MLQNCFRLPNIFRNPCSSCLNECCFNITRQLNKQENTKPTVAIPLKKEHIPPIWPIGHDLPITRYHSLVKILASCGAPFQICSRIFFIPFSAFFKRRVYGPRVQSSLCTCIAFTSFVVFSLPNINLGDRLSEDRMMNISTMARGAFTSRLRDPEKGKYTTTY